MAHVRLKFTYNIWYNIYDLCLQHFDGNISIIYEYQLDLSEIFPIQKMLTIFKVHWYASLKVTS